jgi:hypothetical protein
METETTTGTSDSVVEFNCQVPKCGKSFKSAPALRMHIVRAHGKGWDTSANFRKKDSAREALLAKKQAYNKKVRAENIAKGLTGSGKPRKRPFRAKKPAFGAKWTPERRRKFKDTWEAKKNGLQPPKVQQDPRDFINHCPNCGKNLAAFFLAAGAMKRREQ